MHREDLSILVLTVLVSLKFHLSLGYKMLNHSMHGAGRRCSQFHRIECNVMHKFSLRIGSNPISELETTPARIPFACILCVCE